MVTQEVRSAMRWLQLEVEAGLPRPVATGPPSSALAAVDWPGPHTWYGKADRAVDGRWVG
ncbi:hypothetical protein ACIBG7_42870 [Nonomuraea sp. NPDC050328]|uniref:hypothetical protein n=1 Tax=Nonomuraea sp. NPDC050328 TaxID=3364361 RepID=UPI0037B4FB0B